MEEWVGGLWHRLVTRAAGGHFPAAAVRLSDMEQHLGVLYRAFGGDPGRRLGGAAHDRHRGRRRWLSRLAGSDERVALASLEAETFRLPACIDSFADAALNRDLYLWLAALAACDAPPEADSNADSTNTPAANPNNGTNRLPAGGHDVWLHRNRQAAARALGNFPGMEARYRRLVTSHLAQRLTPEELPPAEAALERVIRAALLDPVAKRETADTAVAPLGSAPGSALGSAPAGSPLGAGARKTASLAPPPQPVLLWLSPLSATSAAAAEAAPQAEPAPSAAASAGDPEHAHRAERVAMPQPKSPFILMFRAESLLTWGEYLQVNRAFDDDPDDNAQDAARDLDHLSLARGGPPVRSKVKFDLDLPSAAADDHRLGDGIPLPEWDYRQDRLLPAHVRLQPMSAREAPPLPLPPHLAPAARRLRNRFAALVDGRRWQRGQNDGAEIDLDACIRHLTERRIHQASDGAGLPEHGLYCASRPQDRDLACLLLCDLSMSTDSWVSNTHRVIDVVRDAAFLFCEALSATGDRFGVYGFSSVRRGHVRFHVVKDFKASYDAKARGRIAALKPGYYTRMGAALRQATRILAEQPANKRLLLLLSDGKPNDLDEYDSRYGIEDTRMAIIEARRLGITPFCVTIDREAGSYLPHLFGPAGFQVITDPEELPARLPKLYAELSRER